MSLVRSVQRGGVGGGGGASAVTDLTDADVTGVGNTDLWTYNSGTGKWEDITRRALMQNLAATYLGTIIPASGSQADVLAAMQQAATASLANNGAIRVFIPYPGEHLWATSVDVVGTSGARIPGLVIELGPQVQIKKNTATWAATGGMAGNSLFQVGYCNSLHLIGHPGSALDGGQTVTPGTITTLNSLAADLIRLFSVARWVVKDAKFINAADAWLRATPFSSDPNPELMQLGIAYNNYTELCNQFSVTNSSGTQKGPDFLIFKDNYFKSGNSNKFATRQASKGIVHQDNVYVGFLTGFEVDGPGNVFSTGNYYEGSTQRAIQVISNNTNTTLDFASSNLKIDDYAYNCAGGIVLKPDTQADTLFYTFKNADIKITMEAMSSDSGFGLDIDGEFANLKAHLVSPDWTKGIPVRANFRGFGNGNNNRIIIEGAYDFTGNTSRNLIALTSDQMRFGKYAAENVTLEYRNVKAIGAVRALTTTGIAHTAGTASGATTDAAGYAAGVRTINLASSGTGTIVEGDTISFAGDDHIYFVVEADSNVADGGAITLRDALLSTIPASATAITAHTDVIGTAAGATTDAAGYAIGVTTLTLASAGTGTILAGDAITLAGDPNIYIVAIGDTDVSNGGTIVLASPGLRTVLSAATKAITILPKRFIKNYRICGSVEGGFSSGLMFTDTVERLENLFIKGLTYLGNTSSGINAVNADGGEISGNYIDSATSPLTIASSCAGVRLGDNVVKAAGVPTAPTISQGPTMTSATQSSTTVTLTITHGLGTDFTVPALAARVFEAVTSAGVIIPATAVSRTNATTITITMAAAPGASSTLRCYDMRDGFRDPAFLPYDNSGYASPLRAGSVAIT
jgi:hypothetical protein